MEDNRLTIKNTALARMKKKSSKFSSNEDARTSRAVQRKLEQKSQRNISLANHRNLSTPHQKAASSSSLTPMTKTNSKLYTNSVMSTTKKYSKNELETLGKIRYQDMLQWKKDRNKLIEIEKKKRKPTFVSGVYKPDAPKFLFSDDDQVSVKCATPWKSTSKQNIKFSSTSKSTTACESKNKMGISKACKPLEFSARKTPLISVNKQSKEVKGLRGGRILRSSKPVLPLMNNFGITPLPITPTVHTDNLQISKRISKPAESFAPNLFRFEPPSGLKVFDFSSNKKAEHIVCPSLSEDVEPMAETHCFDYDLNKEKTYAVMDYGVVPQVLEVITEAQQTQEFSKETLNSFELHTKSNHSADVSVDSHITVEDFKVSHDIGVLKETLLVVNVPNKTHQIIEIPMEYHNAIEVPIKTQGELDNTTDVSSKVEVILNNSLISNPDSFELHVDDDMESHSNIERGKSSDKDFENNCTVSTPTVDEATIQVKANCDDEDDNSSSCMIGEMTLKLSDSSDTETDDLHFPYNEVSKLAENAGQTPAPVTRRKTRHSLVVINDKDINRKFSPASRLRPRTPCSRSTRRSHSAHCDHFSLDSIVTPNKRSTKKQRQSSLHKSFNIATPVVTVTSDFNEVLSASLKNCAGSSDDKNNSPFKTPINRTSKNTPGRRFRVSSLIDTSPWITKSRGSASSKGKRRQIMLSDLESMFNDIPLDGSLPASLLNEIGTSASPILNHSVNVTDCSLKENMTPELNKLLQPSITLLQEKYKSDVLVWTPDSALSSPAYPTKTNHCPLEENEKHANFPTVSSNFLFDDNCQRGPLSEISVLGNVNNGHQRSRKASVTFADNSSSSEKTGFKFPTTPIAHSSRVSLVIFSDNCDSRDALSQPAKLGEDLIQLDSPIVLPGLRRRSQLKGTHRISLLPGLEPCNEKDENEDKTSHPDDPVEGDLISFDSPTVTSLKKRNKRISKIEASTPSTPKRRSKRVSHILLP